MRKMIFALLISLVILAALIGATIVGVTLARTPAVTGQAQTVATASPDTASIYFSDLYQTEGILPLHTWQPITVYGETFPACVVDSVGHRSTLTVNPDDSRVCGERVMR